jgi:hypothetical protein
VKVAKFVYRNPHLHVGAKAFAGTREKALSLDKDHKPYVRGARTWHHLPDSYDDTKWLVRYRSWKHRVKKRHQWVAHVMRPNEWAWIRGIRDWYWY